jgi:hypothetical protein
VRRFVRPHRIIVVRSSPRRTQIMLMNALPINGGARANKRMTTFDEQTTAAD